MKKGRPSKFNDAIRDVMIRLYKQGKTDEQVAQIVGVSVRVIHNWKGKYPDFLSSMKNAKEMADELVEASLFSRAVGYSHPETKVLVVDNTIEKVKVVKQHAPDTNAAKFWLKNRRRSDWRESWREEIEPPPPPENEKSRMTTEQIKARIEHIEQLLKKPGAIK